MFSFFSFLIISKILSFFDLFSLNLFFVLLFKSLSNDFINSVLSNFHVLVVSVVFSGLSCVNEFGSKQIKLAGILSRRALISASLRCLFVRNGFASYESKFGSPEPVLREIIV